MEKLSIKQKMILSKIMAENPSLSKTFHTKDNGQVEITAAWIHATVLLNDSGPPYKTPEKWQRVWTDLKYNLKKKLRARIRGGEITFSKVEISLIKSAGLAEVRSPAENVCEHGYSLNNSEIATSTSHSAASPLSFIDVEPGEMTTLDPPPLTWNLQPSKISPRQTQRKKADVAFKNMESKLDLMTERTNDLLLMVKSLCRPKEPLDECRLCLNTQNVIVDLFAPNEGSEELVKLIEKMTETKMEDAIGWPRKICTRCYIAVHDYGKFCATVKMNQEAIRKRNENPKPRPPVTKQKISEVNKEDKSVGTNDISYITEIIGDQTIETTMTFKEEPLDEEDDDEFNEFIITETVIEEPKIQTESPEFQPITSTNPIKEAKEESGLSLKCKMCPREQFSTIKGLEEHSRKYHSLQNDFKCCGIVFINQRMIDNHKLNDYRHQKPFCLNKFLSLPETETSLEQEIQTKKIKMESDT